MSHIECGDRYIECDDRYIEFGDNYIDCSNNCIECDNYIVKRGGSYIKWDNSYNKFGDSYIISEQENSTINTLIFFFIQHTFNAPTEKQELIQFFHPFKVRFTFSWFSGQN